MMLADPVVNNSYGVTRTDPNEYNFGEFGAEQPFPHELPPRNPKKQKSQPYLSSVLEPRSHLKPLHPVVQPKQRSSSNEKPASNPTLDRIFGGNFKVVEVFSTMRDSSEEHFPEDPITRRLSPRKQNNFEIAEADEEEEDIKESRRENRDKVDKKAGIFEVKGSFPSYLQSKITKSITVTNLDGSKSPVDDKEITLRASRAKFYQRHSEDSGVITKQLSHPEFLLAQVVNQGGSSGFAQRKKKTLSNSRAKLQSTFFQHNSSFHGRAGSKNSESNILPPLNLVLESTPIDLKASSRGRKLKKDFFKTQTQFTQSNYDGQHSPIGRNPLDSFDGRKHEKENKFTSHKSLIEAKFKDDSMHLIEKYADRFQLNVDECNSIKADTFKLISLIIVANRKAKAGIKGTSPDRVNLAISTVRISTPFKSILTDPKPTGSVSVRGHLPRKSKNFFG